MCQFWLTRGYLREGREWLARLLRLGETSVSPAVRAKGLAGAGHLAHNQGDYAAARRLFEASLALWRELGDSRGIATALNDLGWVAWRQGDYTAARTLSAESLVRWRELGDSRGIATSLTNLGRTAHHQGDYTTASALHQEGLALRQEVEDLRGMALSLAFLGWTVSRQGDYARAATLLEEALALFRDLGMTQLVAFAASVLAEVVHAQEDSRRAMVLLEESVRLFRDLGDKWGHVFSLSVLGTVVHAQGDARQAPAPLHAVPQRGHYIVRRPQRDISGVETTTILHRRDIMYALRQVKMQLVVACLAVLLGAGGQTAATAHDFEVWLVDQSNSPGLTYGGMIYIYDGADLKGKHLSDAAPTATVNLAGATTALCQAETGEPVRLCSCSTGP